MELKKKSRYCSKTKSMFFVIHFPTFRWQSTFKSMVLYRFFFGSLQMSPLCQEFRLPPLISDTSWDSAHVSVGRQRQRLQSLRNRMERQCDVCLPILAGSAKALRDLDWGWSKDETGVSIWTLGKQGMKKRTCTVNILIPNFVCWLSIVLINLFFLQ